MAPSQNNLPFVLNVGNSIIGVTLLAMPFCFKTCGILLGALLLFFSTWLTLRSCQLLMKAGVTSRRRSYSLLAQYTHGASGKLIVELGMIGLQFGTIVAQLVIIGDLGPPTVSKFIGIPTSDQLRTGTIVCVCLFVALPLALLKDLRTLSKASMMCILFYMFFTLFIVFQSHTNLWKGDWIKKVTFWNMNGFFRCLPIFSFAFGCQTQLFIVYDALSEPSLKRINSIVGSAVHMCTVVYLMVGFFGYIAFCEEESLSGDIITHLQDSTIVDVIKLCFASSIAVSLPLIVFPCRASLYTLLFPQRHKDDIPGHGKIPEFHFMMITVGIILACMVTTILVPNIEVVLALTGSTTGCLICYIFPALFFLSVMSEGSDKLSGRVVLALGLIIMIASTYTTVTTPSAEPKPVEKRAQELLDVPNVITKLPVNLEQLEKKDKGDAAVEFPAKAIDDTRQEPPIPQEPFDAGENPVDNNIKEQNKEGKEERKSDQKLDPDNVIHEKVIDDENKAKAKHDAGVDDIEEEHKKKDDVIDEEELEKAKLEEAVAEEKKKEAERKQEEILEKLEHQQEEQQKLIEEQKVILEQLKQHQEKHQDAKPESLMLEGVKQNLADGQQGAGANLGIQPVGQQGAGANIGIQQVGQQGPGVNMENQQAGQQQQLQGQLNQVPVQGNQQQVQGNQQQGEHQQLAAGNQQILGNQQVGNQQNAGNQQLLGNQQVPVNPPNLGQPAAINNVALQGNQQINLPVAGNQAFGNQPNLVNQLPVDQQQGNQQAVNFVPLPDNKQGNPDLAVNAKVQEFQQLNPNINGEQNILNKEVANAPLANNQEVPLNPPVESARKVAVKDVNLQSKLKVGDMNVGEGDPIAKKHIEMVEENHREGVNLGR